MPGLKVAARRDVSALLGIAATGLVLGPLAGLLWYAVAPRPVVVVASGGALNYAEGAIGAFFGADGWFTLITAVCGLGSGIVAFAWRGRTGVPALLGLLVSAAVGALLAWRLGSYLGGRNVPTDEQALKLAVGTRVTAPLELRSLAALPVWAIAATTAFFSLSIGFSERQP